MREAFEFPRRPATVRWRRRACQIAAVLLVGVVLAGCDRCGDLNFPGTTACRQEAPKPR